VQAKRFKAAELQSQVSVGPWVNHHLILLQCTCI